MRKRIYKLFALSPFFFIRRVYAEDDLPWAWSISDFNFFIGNISSILFWVGLILGFGVLIKAGYSYMTSQGDPQKLKEASSDIFAALTGSLFILGSSLILKLILRLGFGIE